MTEKGTISDIIRQFANLRLSTKLLFSFGIVFLAFLAVIITASVTLSDLAISQEEAFQRDIPATEGMATLGVNIRRLKSGVQMLILVDDSTGKDKAIKEIESVVKENGEIVEQLTDLFEKDREMSELLVSIDRRLKRFNTRIKQVLIPIAYGSDDSDEKGQVLRDERENINEMETLSVELKELTTKYAKHQTLISKQAVQGSIGFLWFVCAIGIAGSLVLVIALSRLTINPLVQLTLAARQLEESSEAATVKDDGRTDEVGVLARAFNSMAITLQEKEMERDKALSNLELSNLELKQFAYVAAHDLKEPLRTISNYMSLLGERLDGKLDEKGEKYWKTIIDSSIRMDALISGLLTYAKLGSKSLSLQQINLNDVVGKVLSDLKVVINETGATVEKQNLPQIYADGTQMAQLFQNLIQNGIKFRKGGAPKIEIAANRTSNGWMFYVRDNGMGFDMQFQDRIFMIFQRLHGRDEFPGTGLGLAVCKRIAERHGGKIWAESVEGEGTTFYFTVPDELHQVVNVSGGKEQESASS